MDRVTLAQARCVLLCVAAGVFAGFFVGTSETTSDPTASARDWVLWLGGGAAIGAVAGVLLAVAVTIIIDHWGRQ